MLLKKNLRRLLLSKLSRDSDIGISGGFLLGTKVRPNERTSTCGGLRDLEERLVMYLFLFNIFWFSFLVSLWAAFLAFLFLYFNLFLI